MSSGRVIDRATLAPSAAQRRNRLLTVRRFALALRAEDGRHEVPTADAFGTPGPRRRKPSNYAPQEITRLLAASARLRPPASLKSSTYETLFGSLAATGMRVSEALAFQVADVMADELLIRTTKFQKSRLLPLHGTVRIALGRHLQHRARTAACSFLVLGNGAEPSAQNTVPYALWCCGQALDGYEKALWLTAAARGDSNTICAIVGGVVARHVGPAGVPDHWRAYREPMPGWHI